MTIKGFTLIELIIVIGIIALLATTVILVINPANLFREARDSQRIADLGQLNSAFGLYLATVPNPNMSLDNPVGGDICAWNNGVAVAGDWWASSAAVGSAFQPFANPTVAEDSRTLSATPRAIDGTGWIPVNFGLTTGGSPISGLPIDPNPEPAAPLDTTGRFYAYACDDGRLTYELNANMESDRFGNVPGNDNVEQNDGGTSACSGGVCNSTKANSVYEVGNATGLAL